MALILNSGTKRRDAAYFDRLEPLRAETSPLGSRTVRLRSPNRHGARRLAGQGGRGREKTLIRAGSAQAICRGHRSGEATRNAPTEDV